MRLVPAHAVLISAFVCCTSVVRAETPQDAGTNREEPATSDAAAPNDAPAPEPVAAPAPHAEAVPEGGAVLDTTAASATAAPTAAGDAAAVIAVPASEPLTQPANADDDYASLSLEELLNVRIVTAQRYEQDVQKTPVSVSAFSTRAMELRGATNLQDLSKFTPNLQLQPTNRPAGGGSAYAAFIRGIGTGDFQFPTDPGVGLYVDDVYMARTMGGLLPIDSDIERVEVIKGPQGTLFGRNTIGGAFNIVTNKPRLTGTTTGGALLRYGEYGRRDIGVSVNGPLLDQVIGAKLSVTSLHSDGYGRRLLDGQRTNDEDRYVARGGLLVKLSDAVNIRLDGDYTHQDQSPPAGIVLRFAPSMMTQAKIDKYNMFAAPALNPGLGLPAGSVNDARWVSPGSYDTYALQPMYDRYDRGGLAVRLQWNASEAFNLKSITAARFVSSNIAVDGDQTPYSLQSSHTRLKSRQYSQEIQLTGQLLNQRLTYMVGLYVLHEVGKSRLNTESYHGLYENEPMPIPPDAGDTYTRFGLISTSYAAFTQETFRIIDGLHLTAGARINHDEKKYDYSVDFTQRDAVQIPATRADAGWTSFTPKVGLDWSPIEPVFLYASYSQGFKSGGFSASNNPTNPAPSYDPERVTAYEAGLKTHWFENRSLTTTLAGFYNDYRDIQLTVQSVDPVTNANVRSTQNAGVSKIKGFEAEVAASPIQGLTLDGGVGYVDAKFNKVSPAAIMSRFAVGDRLPLIPDWTFNAGAQYAFRTGAGELTLRGDMTYKGKQFLTAADPTSVQEGYALYSARVSFIPQAFKQLEIALYGINLSDQRFYIYRATLGPTGQETAIAGAPRQIYASAKLTL